MSMTNEQIQALKAAAESATPGEWAIQFGDEIYASDGVNHDQIAMLFSDNSARDAEFIAAANPSVVLSLLADRDSDKALIAESVVLFETLRQRIAELEREKDAMTAAALAMRDDMREDRTLTVKLPKRATADKYVDGTFDNSDLAAIYNTCRLECEVKIKNARAAAGITLDVGE